MTSPNLQADIYDPKTLAAMDQAFAAVWRMLRADDPFRDYASDSELRIAIGKKLLNLVADGVTDPLRLRNFTVESLLVHSMRSKSSRSWRLSRLSRGSIVIMLRIYQSTWPPYHSDVQRDRAPRSRCCQHADDE